MKKPNFFIIGAMKSGTSYLHSVLASHPEIFMADPKEPSFFVDKKDLRKLWPQMAREKCSHNMEDYLSLFDNSTDEKIIGESSTNYSKIPEANGVAERIHHFNNRSKILYIMRNPISRAISHYWHAVRRKEGETRPLEEAIRNAPHYINVSNYAMQIRPYINLFGRENVRCVTLEKISNDPQAEIQNILSWLGVSSEFTTADLKEKVHVTENTVEQTRNYMLFIDNERTREIFRKVVPAFLKNTCRKMVRKEIDRSKIDLNDSKEYLRVIFTPLVEELSTLLDAEFKEWPIFYNN